MDPQCGNISLGLYRRDDDATSQVLVHTYGNEEAAIERAGFISRAMIVMAGLEAVPNEPGWLRFPCGVFHQRALKRAFLDICKLASTATLEPKPLTVFDKKADCFHSTTHCGQGVYQMAAEQETEIARKRAVALAAGYVKLCDLEAVEGTNNQVAFACKSEHDGLMGLLMHRAQNVRAAMREAELNNARGILAAPSQQE